jgi:hypothetical protein
MKSFARLSGTITAVALAGVAVAGRQQVIYVPCRTDALAAAINSANSHGGGMLITTPATAADGLPAITAGISLTGGKYTVISRDPAAATAFRILDVAAGGTLRLTDIFIRNGDTSSLGGGIRNAGTVRLDGVNLFGNTAGNGGALANLAGAPRASSAP